jgi:hypothetical protein
MKEAFAEYLVSSGKIPSDALRGFSRCDWLSRDQLGRLAMLHGLLGGPELQEILTRQEEDARPMGRIAVELGYLSEEQLHILLTGQAVRACLELLEDLALAGTITMAEGLDAIGEFVTGTSFCESAAEA